MNYKRKIKLKKRTEYLKNAKPGYSTLSKHNKKTKG